MSLDDSKREALAVLSAIALGNGEAAAAIPASLLPELRDNVEAARAEQVDRVASWLVSSPWELSKCRSLRGALATTAEILRRGHATQPVSAPAPAPAPPPTATLSRELTVDHESLAAERGLGLKLVRFAVLESLSSNERKRAQVRLGLEGDTLRVAVHLPCYERGEPAGDEALQRAHAAAARCAGPVRVTIGLEDVTAGNIVGRGGSGLRSLLHALNAKLRDEVDAVANDGCEEGAEGEVEGPRPLPMSSAKRRTLGPAGGRGAVLLQMPSRAEQLSNRTAAALRLTIFVARGGEALDDAARRAIGAAVGAVAQAHVRGVKARLCAGRAAAVARSRARAMAAAEGEAGDAESLTGRRLGRGLIGRGAPDLEGASLKESRNKKLWRDERRRGRRSGGVRRGAAATRRERRRE